MGVSEARMNVESINYVRTLTAPFPLLPLVADKMVWLRVASVSAYRLVQLQLFPASSSGCYARLSRCFHAYCARASAGALYSFRPTLFLPNCWEKSRRNFTCAKQNLELLL
jgi:hypothetical protein